MSDAIRITRDADLRLLNTFGVAARAPWLVEVADASCLPEALAHPAFAGAAPLLLGGGSNVLFAADPDGAVLRLTGREIVERERHGARAILRAGAGVDWHALVMHSLSLGLAGLENLALIPGTVGASPIQNIGAYGVELRDVVHAVEAFEPATGALHRLDREACAFGYRDSRFKREPGRFIVTAVEFALSTETAVRTHYAGLADELEAQGVASPTPADVARAVIAIRRRKLPDPAEIGNAGSFFKNPIVPEAQAAALLADHPALPAFRGDAPGTRKLSAAWLIDSLGFRGAREGDAGIAASHALVLVNHGAATGSQLLALARRVAEAVEARYGVALEPEPRLVGARWIPAPAR